MSITKMVWLWWEFNIIFTSFISLDFFLISDTDFRDFKESTKTHTKRIYLVDSGLSFNLPFPLTLRPQRGIELYITCDFSSRASDSTPPFRVKHFKYHFSDMLDEIHPLRKKWIALKYSVFLPLGITVIRKMGQFTSNTIPANQRNS